MDIQTVNNEYVIISDISTNDSILSKMVSNSRIETNHNISHAVDFSTLDTNDVAPFPLMGEPCYIGYLYTDGTNYTCIQEHNRTEHDPSDVPALFRQYRAQGLPWVQPISTNPYQINDWVTNLGESWTCIIKDNVWEPGTVGTEALWELRIDEI